MRVAIVGTFQTGKSTLMNCLIKDCIANVGIGLPTTHVLNYYSGARSRCGRVLFQDCDAKTLRMVTLADFRRDSRMPKHATRIIHELPDVRCLDGNTFIDTPGLDSVGKDASSDNLQTVDIISRVDSVLLVLPNKQISTAIRDVVFPKLRDAGVPVVVVMNCLPNGLSLSAADPNSQQNKKVASQIEMDLCNEGIIPCYIDEGKALKVLPLNAAWGWLSNAESLESKFCDRQTREVFDTRMCEVRNLFSIMGRDIPSAATLADLSNLKKLIDGIADMKAFKAKSVDKAIRERIPSDDLAVLGGIFDQWKQ